MSARASGHTAVMAQKRPGLSDGQPWQDFELFPTPPWATRALFENVLPAIGVTTPRDAWEPCAGLGHMSEVVREYVDGLFVDATDVHDYGVDDVEGGFDFFDDSATSALFMGRKPCDWIITNPPFGQAAEMARRALEIARVGVAFLLRLQFLESEERYALFKEHPCRLAVFSERVAMCEGGYDPRCSTATAYAWFVWAKHEPMKSYAPHVTLPALLIPPGRKRALFRPDVDLKLATRCVPGFVPPSTLKKAGKAQQRMELA